MSIRAHVGHRPNTTCCISFSLNRAGAFTHINGPGLDAVGKRREDIVGLSVEDVAPESPLIHDAVRRALAGEVVEVVVEWGGVTWAATFLPRRAHGGRVDGVDGYAVEWRAPGTGLTELYTLDPLVADVLVRRGLAFPVFRPNRPRRARGHLRLI